MSSRTITPLHFWRTLEFNVTAHKARSENNSTASLLSTHTFSQRRRSHLLLLLLLPPSRHNISKQARLCVIIPYTYTRLGLCVCLCLCVVSTYTHTHSKPPVGGWGLAAPDSEYSSEENKLTRNVSLRARSQMYAMLWRRQIECMFVMRMCVFKIQNSLAS